MGKAMKRIGIDLRMASYTGVGRYVRCLVPALLAGSPAKKISWVGLANPGQDLGWLDQSMEIARPETPILPYSLREQMALGKVLDRLRCDLVHLPHFTFPWRPPRAPVVSTIHDLIYMETSGAGRTPLHEWAARRTLRRCAEQSRRIIAVSNFTKDRIVARLGVPAGKIRVVYHGGEHAAEGSGEGAPREPSTLLSVGNHLPHKNLPFLMRVFARVLAERPLASLVVAGPRGRHTSVAEEAARGAGVAGQVTWISPETDAGVWALYRRATLLVFPSRYEGFGFPVLEAMTLGLPVVAADATSIPEVAGPAALLLPPGDEAAWAGAILSLLNDPARRTALFDAGRLRAREFSWERSATETLAVYEEVLESADSGR